MRIKLLKDIMKRRGIKQGVLADKCGIKRVIFALKMCKILEFKGKEILRISKILWLSDKEIMDIFFNKKVS